ncbi:MAG: hypothetical protein K0U68_00990, partial [Gammaproteobacteria bacterium]|nr:hypothetical protein [Gammaproteobacteria bacterium]
MILSAKGIGQNYAQNPNTIPLIFNFLKLFCGGLRGVFFGLFLSFQTAQAVADELEFCTYNLDVLTGETFNIRDFIQWKNAGTITDWTQVSFAYEDPSTPSNWHLDDFNNGYNVTVTASDAAPGTGNQGDGEYRFSVSQDGGANFDDTVTVRVNTSGSSELEDAKCNSHSGSTTWDTPISLFANFAGKLDYTVIGASELVETNGYGNCQNGPSSSAMLNIPAGATVKSAYLYWYAMEKNITDDYYPYNALSNSASVSFAGNALNITAIRNLSSSVAFAGGTAQYASHFADVTAQLGSSPNGTYTVDVSGGASTSACAYTEENVRGWSLIVVYEDLSLTAGQKIYVYDGMVGFVFSNITAPVTNYSVPALRTAGSMTMVSLQGDPGILGEFMTTSDTSFPDYPADFANSSSGSAIDIDRLSGNFTAASTSMNMNAGSNGDLILLSNVIVSVPSEMDFGDALSTYGNPAHIIPETTTLYLGTTPPDDDVNTIFSATADWDDSNGNDDEGGVVPPVTAWSTNQTETLPVEVNGTGYLNVWIDWNLDGDFDDPGENVANEVAVVTGTNNLSVTVPATASAGDLPSRFRVCSQLGDCNSPTGLANDGEVEDYVISVTSCISLVGDISEIAAGIPVQVSSGDKVFVASNSPLPNSAGHLKAYSVQPNGSVGTAVTWDAATLMDATKRQNKLYSTDATGSKILFNSLDDAAFVAGASPTVAKIKEYTITPSVDGGVYLAGRANGSWLGPMSRGNDVALLTQLNNMGLFLTDSAYRTFYNGTISSRSEKILVSSDDGFLYAFDQSSGQLSWAWMPRTLAEELKDYSSFQSNGYMRGTVDVIDVKDSLGNFATYVLGSYKDGLGQYALKLDSSGGLDSVVWDQDYSGSNTEAPNHGEKDYFRDANGLTYATYVVSNNSSQSTLVIREISTAATNTSVSLNYYATSTPYVIQDFGDSNGPAAKTLYLGDENGNIKRAALLTGGTLDSATNLKTALEGSTVGSLGAAEPILFLGASSSTTGGLYYMRAQSESRLTLLDYNSSTTNWDKRWTSYVGGAGSWNSSGTYTADTSGTPTDDDNDGFFTNV